MANVTAAMVKELREATGAGMMECKKALTEADGDLAAATDILRTRGLAAAAKKAGRATNEGRVVAAVCPECGNAAVVEVNCETDFVAINEKFGEYCDKFAKAVILNNPADLDALKASELDGTKVEDVVTDAIHILGENIQVARFERMEAPANGGIVSYNHMNNKIGVLVALSAATLRPLRPTPSRQWARTLQCRLQLPTPSPWTSPLSLQRSSSTR